MVNFNASSWKSKNLQFEWIRLSKACKYLDEKVQKRYVSWHWRFIQSLKKNWLLIPKMTWGIWWILIWPVASLKVLHFDVRLFSIAYKVSAKKVQKNYLSWHWKKIQTLKKNWFFIWKMTWGIWWSLTWAVESLRICTFVESM